MSSISDVVETPGTAEWYGRFRRALRRSAADDVPSPTSAFDDIRLYVAIRLWGPFIEQIT
jgi:hypothetical protein